jgi:hypothetical protein
MELKIYHYKPPRCSEVDNSKASKKPKVSFKPHLLPSKIIEGDTDPDGESPPTGTESVRLQFTRNADDNKRGMVRTLCR